MPARQLTAAALVLVGLAATVRLSDAEPHAYPSAGTILIDPQASPYRIHVERMGEAALTLGGPLTDRGGHVLDPLLELPVVAEANDHVRVVIDNDDARLLVWIATADLAWSITRPVRLAGRGDTGIWLGTGAPVTSPARKGKRTVVYRHGELELRGAVPADAIARVFPVSVGSKPTYGASAPDLRVSPGGAFLQRQPLMVDVVATRGAWSEVEHRSRYVRIRGWIETARLTSDLGHFNGSGSGSGIGMSHTEQIAIPPGTCLFAGPAGATVGFERAAQRRYVAAHDGDWWQLYVATPWGTVRAWAHALDPAADGTPTWEPCGPAEPTPSP